LSSKFCHANAMNSSQRSYLSFGLQVKMRIARIQVPYYWSTFQFFRAIGFLSDSDLQGIFHISNLQLVFYEEHIHNWMGLDYLQIPFLGTVLQNHP